MTFDEATGGRTRCGGAFARVTLATRADRAVLQDVTQLGLRCTDGRKLGAVSRIGKEISMTIFEPVFRNSQPNAAVGARAVAQRDTHVGSPGAACRSWHVLVAGTRIATAKGDKLVEDCKRGDHVMTRWSGQQMVLDVVISQLPRQALISMPKLTPVSIGPGALGPGLPRQELRLHPMTRLLVDPMADVVFARRATEWIGDSNVARVFPDGVTYVSLLLSVHCDINSQGILLLGEPETAATPVQNATQQHPGSSWRQIGDVAATWTTRTAAVRN